MTWNFLNPCALLISPSNEVRRTTYRHVLFTLYCSLVIEPTEKIILLSFQAFHLEHLTMATKLMII